MRCKLDNSKSYLYINIIIACVTIFIVAVIAIGFNQMFGPIVTNPQNIDFNIKYLPEYALRTTMRCIIAMTFSVIFALSYAILAAKNKRIGTFLIPLLDIFQSVPVLGYLSFSVTAFMMMAPGNIFGIEMAIIFAIFTAQVWNMILSVYQSLTTVPKELYEVSNVYKLNKWQIFWQVELPFAIPGLIWNMVLSISSGLFFIVASEVISVGTQTYILPGMGAYISMALQNMDIIAISCAMFTILAIICILNQLCFAPLISWSHKFRYEFNTGSITKSSWLFNYLANSTILDYPLQFFEMIGNFILGIKLPIYITRHLKMIGYFFEMLWWIAIFLCLQLAFKQVYTLFNNNLSYVEVFHVIKLGSFTALRVLAMVIIATFIWVPVGVFISLRPLLVDRIQPFYNF